MKRNDALEIAGIALGMTGLAALLYAAWQIAPTLAWTIAGLVLLALGTALVVGANGGAE